MHRIDSARKDLVEEFYASPGGPHSPELRLLVNRLRLGPMAERYILVCTKRGREWVVATMPTTRGAKVEVLEDSVFNDYDDAVREIFRLRWETVTGEELAEAYRAEGNGR